VSLHNGEQRRLSRYCSLSIEGDADVALMRFRGELDLSCEEGLHAEAAGITERKPNTVIVDLGDVTFIDLCGLRMIVELDAIARREGFELTLLRADGQVRRSLRITGLDLLLPLAESLPGLRNEASR
jgi:anti-sigma B factor antagonist